MSKKDEIINNIEELSQDELIEVRAKLNAKIKNKSSSFSGGSSSTQKTG